MTWDYELSVLRVSEKVKEWKVVSLKKSNLTAEICKELHEAREQLDRSGLRTDLNPNGSRLTWMNYLQDVGLAKSTVNRWLEHFDTVEQRLLSDDELNERKEIKAKELGKLTPQKPERSEEDILKEQEQAEARKRKLAQWQEDVRKANEERHAPKIDFEKILKEDEPDTDPHFENLSNLIGEFTKQEERKLELHKKIRLTGDNAGHAFNQMLIEYLDNLSSDSERLEACHNGIKIFKNFIRDYQMHSAQKKPPFGDTTQVG
ncbi:MAG: hypothetical protein ISR78_04735 [Spirochaetia bacterium]|nr:hypothetical protein [Spirochaetia bacterium]